MKSKSASRPQRRQTSNKNNEPLESHVDEDSSNARPVKRKRTASKPRDKRYECPQEGCDKSYSRAEHLYRHQLNREYKAVGFSIKLLMRLQTLRSRSSIVTLRDVIGILFARISAPDIERDIPRRIRIYIAGMLSSMASSNLLTLPKLSRNSLRMFR